MTEHWITDDYSMIREKMMPISIRDMKDIERSEELLIEKRSSVSFKTDNCAVFQKQGAFIVLDFGKELCGGLRIVTRAVSGMARVRISFGESLSECCARLGEKNAGNDHSPRDFVVEIPFMSDLTFGQSGFRFARIELLSENAFHVKNIFAVNTLPVFEKEGCITTSDDELNKIIETAAYTLKLNFQNGYIWDGIKRDRLVWCGDLHQEILNSIYLYGDNKNITNSLSFLREETPKNTWINTMPTYSAWWVINLCDYCEMTGNTTFFDSNKDYAEEIMELFDRSIDEDGTMKFGCFLDWPTNGTPDAIPGAASIIMLAAQKYLKTGENKACRSVLKKLHKYLDMDCAMKQTRAYQILAGRNTDGEVAFLEKDGAAGFSTFMAYYILTADAMAGGKNMLPIIKEYFGAMLSRGATTFWEDFNMEWLVGSGRIDEMPKEGEKDIHGDYGAFCYKEFRHSLCHGWASGVISFIIEYMLGLKISDGGMKYEVTPNTLGVEWIKAKIPTKKGWLEIEVRDGDVKTTER